MRLGRRHLALIAVALVGRPAGAQQLPDTAFRPPVPRPAYPVGVGPALCLDEAHHNFHTLADRFWAFGELARRDGFRVAPNRAPFTFDPLSKCRVLVIANAQPNDSSWDNYPTPTPSAFSKDEIKALLEWVDRGGSLLLIADHMPLAGAAAQLAAAFGISFTDGFAVAGFEGGDAERQAAFSRPTLFKPDDGTLRPHPIVLGRDSTERVTQVRSFTGQAFRVAVGKAAPVMILPDSFVSLKPRIAGQFGPDTKKRPVGGWLQGATLRFGAGRVALFGEAAMFSAQLAGPDQRPTGMNAPLAEQNPQFVLNVLHWLARLIDR